MWTVCRLFCFWPWLRSLIIFDWWADVISVIFWGLKFDAGLFSVPMLCRMVISLYVYRLTALFLAFARSRVGEVVEIMLSDYNFQSPVVRQFLISIALSVLFWILPLSVP